MIRKIGLVAGAATCALAATPALADHSWQNYHWPVAGADEPFEVYTVLSRAHWNPLIAAAVSDWAGSDPDIGGYTDYLEPSLAGAADTSAKKCDPVSGAIVVCSESYGRRGWLGIATIWASGDHITQGTTKLNDSYHDSGTYSSTDWRAAVACQEIGHDFGLGHQNEDFGTDLTQSCMEYTSAPAGNTSPDGHDFQQLELIYDAHVNEPTDPGGGSGGPPGGGGGPPDGRGPRSGDPFAFRQVGQPHPRGSDIVSSDWGVAVGFDAANRPSVFELDLGGGRKKITHVTWLPGFRPERQHLGDR